MNKNAIIGILLVALVALGGWTYYTLTITAPAKASVACKETIDSEIIPKITEQVSAAAEEACTQTVTEKVTEVTSQYETMLDGLKQIPECAEALTSAEGMGVEEGVEEPVE